VTIDEENVKSITVSLSMSGAVRYVSLCMPGSIQDDPSSFEIPGQDDDSSYFEPPTLANAFVAPMCEVKERTFEAGEQCTSGLQYGTSAVNVLEYKGDSVVFELDQPYGVNPKHLQIWYDQTKDVNGPPECDVRYYPTGKVGTYEAGCVNGVATISIIGEMFNMETQTSLSQPGFDVDVPECANDVSFMHFNPLKRCYFEMYIPCSKCDRRLEENEELPAVSECERNAMKADIHPIVIDKCINTESDMPIEVKARDGDSITFSVSQVWKGQDESSRGKRLAWMAVDFANAQGDLQCIKTTSVESGLLATHKSQCKDGATVVDLYVQDEDPGLLGQTDGSSIIAPTACSPSGDTRKTCQFRYILKCEPDAKCAEEEEASTKERKRLGQGSRNREPLTENKRRSYWIF
jgi:hypothetical protein